MVAGEVEGVFNRKSIDHIIGNEGDLKGRDSNIWVY